MIRRILTISCFTGLAVSVVAWGVSYFNLLGYDHAASVNVGLQRGSLVWMSDRGFFSSILESRWYETGFGRLQWWFQGYGGLQTQWAPQFTLGPVALALALPLWIPVVVCATYPTYRMTLHCRNRRRRRIGLCLNCGFDLQGSEGACPECGSSIEVPTDA